MDRQHHGTTTRRPAARAAASLLPLLVALGACGSGSGDDPTTTVISPDGGTTSTTNGQIENPPASGSPPPSVVTPAEIVDGVVQRTDVVDIDGLYAYRRDSRYADVLARCALIENADDGCPLSMLPFIAQETSEPTVGDVMERVLVTHDWMGERFEALLDRHGAELLPLFGAVTSIAIGSTVRPSNYWTGTGGIQLDPAGLWLSVDEKANVSIEEDFRAPFRVLLAFRNLWTMHVDGRSIFGRSGLEDTGERELADIERPMLSLLFHELAHANDFLPPGGAPLLDSRLTSDDALFAIRELWLSPSLDERLPLNSELLRDLAQVRFRGEEPSDEQSAVSGTVAGAEMADDGATHFYSYSTIREDFANLFEALQMKRLFDADVHFAYSSQPVDPEDFGCEDLLVEWGVLNRLGNPSVLLRARDSVEAIYGPDPTLDGFVAEQQETEVPMEVGIDWCTNLDRAVPPGMAARSRTVDAEKSLTNGDWMMHEERHAITDRRRQVMR